MYAFCLKDGQIKTFMNDFLKGDIFDGYYVKGAEVFTLARFETDGKINKDCLDGEEERENCTWQELKPYMFGIVKGKIKPKTFKVILSLPTDKAEILSENAASMHITISFEQDRINFITGTSQKSFSLDKQTDNAWEDYIKRFFKKRGYSCETF